MYNCNCKKLSKTRVITVIQVRFDVHSSRSTSTSGLFHFIPLCTSHYRNNSMSRTIVRVGPCCSLHIGCTSALSDIGVRSSGAAPLSRLRRDHRAYSAVPPTHHGNTDPIFPFPNPLTRTNAANISRYTMQLGNSFFANKFSRHASLIAPRLWISYVRPSRVGWVGLGGRAYDSPDDRPPCSVVL